MNKTCSPPERDTDVVFYGKMLESAQLWRQRRDERMQQLVDGTVDERPQRKGKNKQNATESEVDFMSRWLGGIKITDGKSSG